MLHRKKTFNLIFKRNTSFIDCVDDPILNDEGFFSNRTDSDPSFQFGRYLLSKSRHSDNEYFNADLLI